jgi:molybdenum cofactor synthesis domain-containing protein
MIKASIIIIGNEILSGRTLDKNSNFICQRCSKIGITIDEIRVIPDEKKIIKKTVISLSKKYSYVFVTGGIGPTHDDITAESIAEAFKRKLVINKKAKDLLVAHYKKSNVNLNESRMKMAYLPVRSSLILNPVSSAPGFKLENVWVMAGVPKIMQAMFVNSIEPKLKKSKLKLMISVKVNQAEGDIAKILETINSEFYDVEIGSYPFFQPPKIGTNVVFRCENKIKLEKAANSFCSSLKRKSILFSID